MTTLSVKSKNKVKVECYYSLDKLKKRCQELFILVQSGKAEIVGVSFDDEDEKGIILKSNLIDLYDK